MQSSEKTTFDGQWLDFYALLDVPVGADEDAIRKRIGKVYAEAAAQSDHRDLGKRYYYQALVERVLPQCRRVLLDPQWREKYDRQHVLHSIGDASAQNYVEFIASMRGGNLGSTPEAALPERVKEEIKAARGVVEIAQTGRDLDLLPSTAVSVKTDAKVEAKKQADTGVQPASELQETKTSAAPPVTQKAVEALAESAPKFEAKKVETRSETIRQRGEPVRAQVLTAQEATLLRGRRASNPDAKVPVQIVSDLRGKNKAKARIIVEETTKTPKRLISTTSLNLMVAITGVLLTITIQHLTVTPAIATSSTRIPFVIAASPEIASSLGHLEKGWENSAEGQNFDLKILPVDGSAALNRAWGQTGAQPDAWIPGSSLWIDRYNQGAKKAGRTPIDSGASIAQTPMVLIARGDKSSVLKTRFPNRKIPSWSTLRAAIEAGATGHFGLSDPKKTAVGTLARASMAREWGQSRGLGATEAAASPEFWRWMSALEEQIPASSSSQTALLKDLVLGTTGRFWWAIGYESEALEWMKAGHDLEIWTLPRTSLADHPVATIERLGAPVEVARGRASLVNYLRTKLAQETFLRDGFRPTEIAPSANIKGNPFRQNGIRQNGVRLQGLPRDERINVKAAQAIETGWEKRFG